MAPLIAYGTRTECHAGGYGPEGRNCSNLVRLNLRTNQIYQVNY